MELSPGLELAWHLAGREAMAAKMKEIAPDHFFCALLKFSELNDDELKTAVSDPLAVKALVAERDKIRATLKERALPSTRVRHQLRRLLGQGDHQNAGGVLHRSDASRQLFERAARTAQQSRSALDCQHVLHVLLDGPTPAMVQVLGDAGAKALPAELPARKQALDRGAQDILQLADGGRFDPPAVCAPQVQVLSQALQSSDPAPILLICAPRVGLLPVVECAAQQARSQRYVARVDLAAVLEDAEDGKMPRGQIADLLTEAAGIENLLLFFDVTTQKPERASLLLSALKPSLGDPRPRLAVAVSTEVYHKIVENDPSLDGVFRVIWLHELTDAALPDEL